MIEVYDAYEIRFEPDVFEDMHRLRYRVFRERQGWDVGGWNGMEIDEFDTPELNPVYFVCRDDAGAVVASVRLLPSTGPNMLRDVFYQLMNGDPVPERDGLWELSRFAVDADPTTQLGLKAFNTYTAELLCALGEWGVPNGIDEVVAVYDIMIGRLLRRIGARPIWLSKRHRIGDCITVAASYDISEASLQEIRQGSGVDYEVVQKIRLSRASAAA